jgi:hypothetical protein
MAIHDLKTTVDKTGFDPRRSLRVVLAIPITVTGSGEMAFSEETTTLIVNAHGALITLAAKVEMGDTVLVRNRDTRDERICKVTFLGPVKGGRTPVGIEFREVAPEFWHIQFP